MVTDQDSRDKSLDAVRALACLGVILCHVASPFRFHAADDQVLFAANLLDTLSRPAVGIFFMLAGLFALNRRRTPTIDDVFGFYWRKFARVVLPTAVMLLFYMAFLPKDGAFRFAEWRRLFDVGYVFGTSAYPLWFMYPLIAYFAVTPVLWFLAGNLFGRALIRLAVVAWFLLAVVAPSFHFYGIPVADETGLSKTLLDYFNSCLYLKHFGWYLIGGYYLEGWSALVRGRAWARWQARLACLVMFAVTLAVPYCLIAQNIEDPFDSWRDFVRPNVFFYSLLALVLARSFFERSGRLAGLFARFARLSFTAYLIHAGVLWVALFLTGSAYDLRHLGIVALSVLAATYVLSLCCHYIACSVMGDPGAAGARTDAAAAADDGAGRRRLGHLYLCLILLAGLAFCAYRILREYRETSVTTKSFIVMYNKLELIRDLRDSYRDIREKARESAAGPGKAAEVPPAVVKVLDDRYRKWKMEIGLEKDKLLAAVGRPAAREMQQTGFKVHIVVDNLGEDVLDAKQIANLMVWLQDMEKVCDHTKCQSPANCRYDGRALLELPTKKQGDGKGVGLDRSVIVEKLLAQGLSRYEIYEGMYVPNTDQDMLDAIARRGGGKLDEFGKNLCRLQRAVDFLCSNLPGSFLEFVDRDPMAYKFWEVEFLMNKIESHFFYERITWPQWATIIIPVLITIVSVYFSCRRD